MRALVGHRLRRTERGSVGDAEGVLGCLLRESETGRYRDLESVYSSMVRTRVSDASPICCQMKG